MRLLLVFAPEILTLAVLAWILVPASVEVYRIRRASLYRMKLLAFVEAIPDVNERALRLLWVFCQPNLTVFIAHRGDYDDLLEGPLAADFAAWNAINSK